MKNKTKKIDKENSINSRVAYPQNPNEIGVQISRTAKQIAFASSFLFSFDLLNADDFQDLDWGLSNAAVTSEGYLDVTKAPYSLKKNGTDANRNSTWLQNAIDDAHEHNLAIFFPAGTYLVNKQFNCYQTKDQMTDSHVITGSAAGARPIIKLANSSNGFTNSETPKPVFYFFCSIEGDGTGQEYPAAAYNFVIRGINFDLGSNPGAVAVDMHAAQGSTIQDVDIYGSNFFAGIKDLCGSGTQHANILVDGGQYAFYITENRPLPLLTGITCLNQSNRAFYTTLLGPINIVGFKIIANNGPVFDLQSSARNEHLNLIDGSIEFTGTNTSNAIKNRDRSVYMRNVWVKNADKVCDNWKGADIVDNSGNWCHIGDYNYFHVSQRQLVETTMTQGVYGANSITMNSSPPPSDLISRHLWNEDIFPHFEDPNVIIIGPGTASDNDAARIQSVIDSANGKTIFLEKGDYYLETSINLLSDTKLVGVSRNLTRLHCKTSFTSTWFRPMISTPNDPDATCLLAWMALQMPDNQADKIIFTDWKAGRHSMVREVHFKKAIVPGEYTNNAMKRIRISDGGGGRWYSLFSRSGQRDGEHINHRLLLVENTSEPLSIYALTVEYQESLGYMAEFRNAENVSIYSFKCETDLSGNDNSGQFRHTPALGITNSSSNIMVMGHSGYGELDQNSTKGLVEIKGSSTDIQIANMGGGWNTNSGFYLVKNIDSNVGIKKLVSGAGDPVALYIKGNPDPVPYVPLTGLFNPGFENNTFDDWTESTPSQTWLTGTTAANGSSYSAVMQANGNLIEVWQEIPATPGQQFRVSGYFKMDGIVGANGAGIRADFRKPNGSGGTMWATGSGTWNGVTGGWQTGSLFWTYYEKTVTTPSDGTVLRIRLMSKDATAGIVRFDELNVTPL